MTMNEPSPEIQDQIRQQFDSTPYPNIPFGRTPKQEPALLYFHSWVTAYYIRNQKVSSAEGKVILDAGCGTGYKSLVLAEANPGAKIIGVDLSPESVKIAGDRLRYHGFTDTEFYAISLEDLPSLNIQFDYINCDETLYLLPDINAGLQAMQAVLSPEGMIRVNLHSAMQRHHFFRSQEFFNRLGVMEEPSQQTAIELVRETMKNLKDSVFLKTVAWKPTFEVDDERVIANHLLRGDKGFKIPDVFAALKATNLEFISMVQWWQWNLADLFQDVSELPMAIALQLADFSLEEQLHCYELLHPVHRLIDFWCGHPEASQPFIPVSEWEESQWLQAKVFLHPQLQTPAFQADLAACVTQMQSFDIHRHLPIQDAPAVLIDSAIAFCLLPLLTEPYTVSALVEYWRKLRPLNPVTLAPTTVVEAFTAVQQLTSTLANFGYLLLEA